MQGDIDGYSLIGVDESAIRLEQIEAWGGKLELDERGVTLKYAVDAFIKWSLISQAFGFSQSFCIFKCNSKKFSCCVVFYK